MGNKGLKAIVLLLLGFGQTGLQAQESNNTTGSIALGSGGSVSYSIGQVVYQTHTGTNGSVNEGVQQPYEISVITGIEEMRGINLSVLAYPNPTTGLLQLKVEREKTKKLSYQLFDINGKLLQTEEITGNETNIVMGNFMPATYFVKVIQDNLEVKSIKIIKK